MGYLSLSEKLIFFDIPSPVRLHDLALNVGAVLRDNIHRDRQIFSIEPIETAEEGCLSFINNAKYLLAAQNTNASAVICSENHALSIPNDVAVLISKNPYKSFAKTMAQFFPLGLKPQPQSGEMGISSHSSIHESAVLENDVIIESGAVIGPEAHIGARTFIGVNALIGRKVQVGRDASISSHASIIHAILGDRVIIHNGVRIGSDGFGFAMEKGGHLKIPQIGRVVIQDDVEVGANTCVDRGANRDTIIGEGTKIDNLVMIGHNVVIGRHCIIVGQAGVAGSAELGDYVVLGGKAAISGHVKIGKGAQIAGLSGVSGNVPPDVQWGGIPARPVKHWMREIASLKREAHDMDRKRTSKKE
ncbi:UDP-3-O-(3-hydroxymyristoyl)glucosamine N-acyltransferase [Candidatus Endowatersipora endosymbiont of Watersipora subatra]|uniref:UDP-3-O-(3-hydroxymyristoyl)glucosamine N-acyltransferase n=1 Tax=Candidatus Endowatersipora endosymbiont of Watersipora subatra TaxID=3077946 RepID=UPI00312C893D